MKTDKKKSGIPALTLMENAGKAVAGEVAKAVKRGRVMIFAGYGNNGGDALVAARHLANKDYDVKVYFVGPPKSFSPESNKNLESLFTLGMAVGSIPSKDDIAPLFDGLKTPAAIVDGIFGIGLKGEVDDFYKELIDRINSAGAPVISIDIPSGLDADTGEVCGKTIKAATTVTFGYPKAGFVNPNAEMYIGKVVVADIGLPAPSVFTKAIQLKKGKSGKRPPRHPWIYRYQIARIDHNSINGGDTVTILGQKGEFIGRGYYNPKCNIAARILTFKDEPIDKKFFDKAVRDAAGKRKNLLSSTNAYRVISSEADSLPGIIADIYDDTLVFQILTLGMEKMKDIFVQSLKDVISPKYIYEKSDSVFRKIEGMENVRRWWTDKREGPIEIFENKAKFIVDVEEGHKTGSYLDQRKSRLALANFAKGRKVLDLFCYTGGFSISAAINGASSVRGVDIKEDWLEMARKNATLNGVSERTEFVKGNAFTILRNIYDSGEKFDMIIVDPPSFLHTREEMAGASRGYKELNLTAMKVLSEDGILATFSCSYNMPNEVFFEILKNAARDAKKRFEILKRCHQAEDHPILKGVPETNYLKGYFLRVENA